MGECFGDCEEAVPGAVSDEDALHNPCGKWVGLQAMQSLAVCGFGGVGMRAGVGEPVAVRWAPALEAALDFDLGAHGRARADLDPVALTLTHASEDGHDHVVGFGVRVDRPAHLRDPQRHAVVGEDGEGEAELVAVEGTLGLADDYGVKAAVGVFEGFQKRRCLRAAAPGG
ncbi:hypothetical protein ABGB09_35000 [Streptomyces sp. B8F3]|uniref:hypothetical protein n=1 Tax=Streptomyces sp. B8F3 TaxID=3153573 RepID=UPI00325F68C1